MGVGDASLKMKIIYTITQFILLESEGTMDRLNERGCAKQPKGEYKTGSQI